MRINSWRARFPQASVFSEGAVWCISAFESKLHYLLSVRLWLVVRLVLRLIQTLVNQAIILKVNLINR